MPGNGTKLNLLDLPVDILSIILQPLVTSPTPIQVCPCAASPINPLAVLLTHPALHAIAAPLLFTANEFVLDGTGPHAQHVRRRLAEAEAAEEAEAGQDAMAPASSLLTTRDARLRMANLLVRFDRLRGWVHDGLVPMLMDMVVQGALEHLTVWVRSPPEGRHPQVQPVRRSRAAGNGGGGNGAEDLAMFTRPPLEGLLRVLADPFLRTARLWVDSRRHVRAWCRFHAGGPGGIGCGAGAGAETAGAHREASREEARPATVGGWGQQEDEDMVLEIDWRLILRVVDPERKDVALVGDGRSGRRR
ncbi:hypothetical protein B0J13DRAFT_618868 [Dactylonectria estremocensis]|uniref:Uncharacterized protein n=1 Tax=Dactylonectria estremocensis TaxID=1079267 RepID=A0A9P9JEQ9_9HYPO|nr:hypothetical protein B0J13DRAFT_618868 [Dactylonectria estremocensis]